MTTKAKYHAIVLHSHFTRGRVVQHHTTHRTLAAAARSLSKGITAARTPAPAYVTWCSVIAPDGAVMSLRQAQGKTPIKQSDAYPGLVAVMREIAQ
jgi:hypothetical protein